MRPSPTKSLPLRWHTRPDGSGRALFPALQPWQVRRLFDLAEQDRRAHPLKKKTVTLALCRVSNYVSNRNNQIGLLC